MTIAREGRDRDYGEVDYKSALGSRLAGLQDNALRIGAVTEWLAGLPAETFPTVVASMFDDAPNEKTRWVLVCHALYCEALHERRVALSAHATLRPLFWHASPSDLPARVPEYDASRPLTLGERKTLARKPDRDLISRAIRDPHPGVISVLLSNPVVTERDVIRICATRPVPSAVLQSVSTTSPWFYNAGIRFAIVANPYCPPQLARRWLPTLKMQDWKRVVKSPEVEHDLQIRAQHLLISARRPIVNRATT